MTIQKSSNIWIKLRERECLKCQIEKICKCFNSKTSLSNFSNAKVGMDSIANFLSRLRVRSSQLSHHSNSSGMKKLECFKSQHFFDYFKEQTSFHEFVYLDQTTTKSNFVGDRNRSQLILAHRADPLLACLRSGFTQSSQQSNGQRRKGHNSWWEKLGCSLCYKTIKLFVMNIFLR